MRSERRAVAQHERSELEQDDEKIRRIEHEEKRLGGRMDGRRGDGSRDGRGQTSLSAHGAEKMTFIGKRLQAFN